MKIIFCDTFTHTRHGDNVDEIRFSQPVLISGCRVIPPGVSPHSTLSEFTGKTSPATFVLQAYARNLRVQSDRFQRICRPYAYSEDSALSIEVEAIITDHVVLRGPYDTLSIVIYGAAAPLNDLALEATSVPTESSALTARMAAALAAEAEVALPLDLREPRPVLPSPPPPLKILALTSPHKPAAASLELLHAALELDDRLATLSEEEKGEAWKVLLTKLLKATASRRSADEPDLMEDSGEAVDAEGELSEMEVERCLALIIEWSCAVLADPAAPRDIRHICRAGLKWSSEALQRALCGLNVALLLCERPQGVRAFAGCGAVDVLIALLRPEAQLPSIIQDSVLLVLTEVARSAAGCELLLNWLSPAQAEKEGSPVEPLWPEALGPAPVYCCLIHLLLTPQHRKMSKRVAVLLHKLRVYELAAKCQYSLDRVLKARPPSRPRSHPISFTYLALPPPVLGF
ncbi:hypothetical protein CYMTET_11586 [Cymbomonas tetramitiformis]|uniref:Virilizer N-terminal domain-containing protein n=1 Tax=Cymbomonas tetramitiformis TaxID=36881 RepID=A0AAE0GM01_9CHLO|nr:hypothetical protein CYMTET_11586 [Cymbomonas tetramitiformis]